MITFEDRKHQTGLSINMLLTEEHICDSSDKDVQTVKDEDVTNGPQSENKGTHIQAPHKFLFVKAATEINTDETETSFNEQQPIENYEVQSEKILTIGNKSVRNKRNQWKTSVRYYKKIYQQIVFTPATNLKETAITIVTQFARTSTVDALHYTIGKKGKLHWIPLFIVVAIYCFYQCQLNVGMYLRFDVVTKSTEEAGKSLDFPAITICPMRMFKKSALGNIPGVEYALSCIYANTIPEISELMDQNKRTCDNRNNSTNEMKAEEIAEIFAQIVNGSIWMSNKFSNSYEDVLLECIWERKIIDCGNMFLNSVGDLGECFTFNPGYAKAEFMNKTMTGYGLNLSKYSESQYINVQGNHQLKLVFNIKQFEYCGNELLKRGAGLFFQIHGINRTPSFIINPSTYIGPGYDTNILIEKQVYIRKTEHLGRCKSFVPLYMTPDVGLYVMEVCYMQCVAEHILKHCHCFPPNLGSFESAFRARAKEMGLPETYVQLCFGDGYLCLREWIHFTLSTTSFDILCPYCKQPCDETKYSTLLTSLRLSARNLEHRLIGNISLSELRKNYIIANFILKSSSVKFIVEEQAFDLKDLFIYIGNNLGLYLGMSFTSLFELVYFVFQLLSVFLKSKPTLT